MNPLDPSLDTNSLIAFGVIVFLLSYSAYTEVKDNKIPNWLTYSGMALGLTLGFLPGGLPFSSSLIGFLVGFLSLFVFYMSGGLGGGDVKLMGAFGALFGFPLIIRILIYSSFIGAVMAITLMVWKTDPWETMKDKFSRKTSDEEKDEDEDEDEESDTAVEPKKKPLAVPFGLAICAGVLISMFAQIGI